MIKVISEEPIKKAIEYCYWLFRMVYQTGLDHNIPDFFPDRANLQLGIPGLDS